MKKGREGPGKLLLLGTKVERKDVMQEREVVKNLPKIVLHNCLLLRKNIKPAKLCHPWTQRSTILKLRLKG
jgi:hypothetical protein